ncbi:hypothetical protein PBY51_015635 [Eleginops maclovinus]|uniref:Uncharacterized protein n=1 Tax=Eleginops maclovinus TaxID=56733 RepID=A0AAN8AQ26_ELEMC|nr:hypothetical protein PBY51_015635 [Eleginops maclovinus]
MEKSIQMKRGQGKEHIRNNGQREETLKGNKKQQGAKEIESRNPYQRRVKRKRKKGRGNRLIKKNETESKRGGKVKAMESRYCRNKRYSKREETAGPAQGLCVPARPSVTGPQRGPTPTAQTFIISLLPRAGRKVVPKNQDGKNTK